MAQYKVPQDVEAEDKLIGPFSFRQFVYLLIAGGLIALAVGLFQIFPALVIIPLPFILFFGALALPLKKDQPMETYLAAIISYYLKPHNRTWTPGQRESTIQITAPKIAEESRTRNITGEEATHRLSFLADIVDTEGYAIRGESNIARQDLINEANTTADMFETDHFDDLGQTIESGENERHQEVMQEMRNAIDKNEDLGADGKEPEIEKRFEEPESPPDFDSSAVVQPNTETEAGKNHTEPPKPSIMELANNPDFSVATIAKEANRIKEKEGEVFISLH